VAADTIDATSLRAALGNVDLNSEDLKICAQFSDFKFQGWQPQDKKSADITENTVACLSKDNGEAPVALPTLDMNTEYMGDGSDDEGLDNMDFADDFEGGNELAMSPFDTAEDAEHSVNAAAKAKDANKRLGLLEDNEFGWLQGRSNTKGWHGEASYSVPSKAAGDAKKAKGPKKERFLIDFTEAKDWTKLLGKSRASTVLAKSTLNSQQPSLLPEDHQFSVDDLTALFLIPSAKGKTILSGDAGDVDDDEDDGDGGNDGWNDDDGFDVGTDYAGSFSPDIRDTEDTEGGPALDTENLGQGMAAAQDSGAAAGSQASSLQLIDNVKQVEKISIGFAQKPKVMDVKKLKQHLWNDIEENTVQQQQDTERADVASGADADTRTFTQLWNEVPKKVNQKMADNLSVPIMFVCLLYLANDKELRIESVDDMDNLLIQQKMEGAIISA